MITWYIGHLAEWAVAKRENWQLYRISAGAWLWLALHVAIVITVIVWAVQ